MKKGDLVLDRDGDCGCGIIVAEERSEGMFKVVWTSHGKEWLTEMYLEVVVSS